MPGPGTPPSRTRKVVSYIVHAGRLLVFVHDDVPLVVAGVQVPAGTVEPGEEPAQAAVREALEETKLHARVVRSLGVMDYDMRPRRNEIAERHFFLMALTDAEIESGPPERWAAGEADSSDGSEPQRWTCWWLPLEDGHALSGGFGQALGRIFDSDPVVQQQ